MAVYSVLEPPSGANGRAAPDRVIFVRDGFNWWAFLLGPLWILWRRLWLILLGYLLIVAAMEGLFRLTETPYGARVIAGLLIGLLVGLEAASLQRWTLLRRRWRDRGIVVADDLEAAERRFFAGWAAADATKRPATTTTPPASDHAEPTPESAAAGGAGLVPQPGGPA